MTIDPALQAILRDPAWLPHRYDPQHDAFHFFHVSREDRRTAAFLTDDDLKTAGKPPLVVTRADAMVALAPLPPAPLHFVFHSAFCCSTLMARALDREGVATMLSEPVVLNDLVGWRRRGAPADRLDAVLRDTLRLLARPFRTGEAVVVKPSNIVTLLAPLIIATTASTRALAMYAPLPTFLASVAKKGIDGRLWVRGLFVGFMGDGIADLGFDAAALFGQTDLQIAALGWLAQHRQFHRLVAGRKDERIRTLGSDAFLADPARSMAAAAALMRLPLDDAAARAIGNGPVFGRHSKSGQPFDLAERRAEYDTAGQQHGEEIERVLRWAEQVAQANAIALTLPGALIA